MNASLLSRNKEVIYDSNEDISAERVYNGEEIKEPFIFSVVLKSISYSKASVLA